MDTEEGQGHDADVPKTLEEAQRQTESKWRSTMDEMETSRNTQGFYFAKFGRDVREGVDSRDLLPRVLVIKDRIVTAEGEGWVFITKDGPKFLSIESPEIAQEVSKKINQRIQIEIELASNEQPFSETGIHSQGWIGDSLVLGSSLDYSSVRSYGRREVGGIKITDIPNLDIVKAAINKSRESAEMPRKRTEDKIADEQAKVVLARDVINFIDDLPPRA